MCGIAGVFGRPEQETVRVMLETLTHRGPDDSHLVAGRDFSLGARRLAIIDLAGGRQPLSNETGDIWIVQNGELYEYPELQRELAERGHRLATRCDTEVAVHLYEDVGPELPKRVDGMFAMAIWDEPQRRGLLARDRLGKKPLYYLVRDGALYFASEIKALLRVPGFERRIDAEALHHYLSYKHVPCPLSIFQGIRQLPPGHVLEFIPGRESAPRPYWRLDFSAPLVGEEAEPEAVADRLLDLLTNAVRRRLRSDVPVGFFLSGGLDSSLITALGARATGGAIQTFTLAYPPEVVPPGKDLDRALAHRIAREYGTRHEELVLEPACFPDELPGILRHFDEPFAGVVSSFFLSRLIAKHVKVALAGDGADELFGSYLSHRLAPAVAAYLATGGVGTVAPFEGRAGFLERIAEPEDWRWRAKLLLFSEAEKRTLYTPEWRSRLGACSTEGHLRAAFARLSARDPLNRVLEAELHSFFPDQVLTYADRLSMAHSLEVRSPYLDTAFVEFAARIPGSLKITSGRTKAILKHAARRILPPSIVDRQKEGFVLPLADWARGELAGFLRDVLAPQRLRRRGVFDPRAVGRLLEVAQRSDSGYEAVNRVLSIAIFEVWHELYMDA